MEHIVDLDHVALEVAERRPAWERRGLVVGHVTWRDETAPWPQRLEPDRSSVTEPDSIGILLTGPGDAQLSVVLFRGGWADIDFITTIDDTGALPTPDIDSARTFGNLLDHCVARVFGSQGSERQNTP